MTQAIHILPEVAQSLLGERIHRELQLIVELASSISRRPIAAVNFLSDEYQFIVASVGIDGQKTSARSESFCQYTVAQQTVYQVKDARIHPAHKNSSFVTGPSNIVSYTGVPLNPDATQLQGALCVMGHVPHTLTLSEEHSLQLLAQLTDHQISKALHSQPSNMSLQLEKVMQIQAKLSVHPILVVAHNAAVVDRLSSLLAPQSFVVVSTPFAGLAYLERSIFDAKTRYAAVLIESPQVMLADADLIDRIRHVVPEMNIGLIAYKPPKACKAIVFDLNLGDSDWINMIHRLVH